MVSERLVDLDEMVLRCADEQSRSFLAEAVVCYRSGAFRSCIIATWVAVVFDFLHKLRQLELTGDLKAKAELAKWERIRTAHDLAASLEWERSVLDLAREEFEFISPLEHSDLLRLREDRNPCAHPSMNSQEEVYNPSAELARYHLRNAVTHLLQHPPVQGKAAQGRLENEVSSPYFPEDVEAAERHFEQRALKRPRESLVRNFTIVLIKTFLMTELDEARQRRTLAALGAVRLMHRTLARDTWESKLSEIIRHVEHTYLYRVVRLLASFPEVWDDLSDDVHGILSRYVEAMPDDHLREGLVLALKTAPLHEEANRRLSQMDDIQLARLTSPTFHSSLVERAVALYVASNNYEVANRCARNLLPPLCAHFVREQIERIIAVGQSNGQLSGSTSLEPFLSILRNTERIPKEEFDTLMRKYNFKKWADAWSEEPQSQENSEASSVL
jgi:hypothetical protein